jgi:isocitrate dehydrogenase
LKLVKAGINYTIGVREDNSICIIGNETILKSEGNSFKNKIETIVCSKFEELFAVLTERE